MKKHLSLLILPLLLTSCGSTNSVTVIELAKKELSLKKPILILIVLQACLAMSTAINTIQRIKRR